MKTPFHSTKIITQTKINPGNRVHWSPFMKLISWLLIFTILNMTGGCMNYFKVKKTGGNFSENIDNFSRQNKTVIVHLEDNVWVLKSPDVSGDKLTGVMKDEYRPVFDKPLKPNGSNRYRTKRSYNQGAVLNEVHIYVSELAKSNISDVSIPLTAIQKIEIYEKDQATTIASWTLGVLGVAAIATLLLTIIVMLTKSSCPFIYTFNGENYELNGEIYSGSIQPQLERHDFLKLPVYDVKSDQYVIKIANEVEEIQHTNLMELWVFDHSEGINIWIDKYGKHYAVSGLIQPISATNLSGENVYDMVCKKDSLFYTSILQTGENALTDGLILEFPKPETASIAKLMVKAKNTFILDYMMGQFQNQFGDLYHKWTKKQRKVPKEKLLQWTIDQNIPLSLAVERNGAWETIDYYNIAGPIAFKEDILAIPLNGTESNPLKIKLESGNFFWDIDYTGIDYSPITEINYLVIPANTAVDQNNKDVKRRLIADDKQYYIQPEVGDNAIVTFKLPENKLENRSVFLHSKGWYQILRDPSGIPDREYLETFKQPGRFNQFVNEYMLNMTNK